MRFAKAHCSIKGFMDLSLKRPASPKCAFTLAVTELYNWNLASQRVSFVSPPLHTMPLLMGHHFQFLEMLPLCGNSRYRWEVLSLSSTSLASSVAWWRKLKHCACRVLVWKAKMVAVPPHNLKHGKITKYTTSIWPNSQQTLDSTCQLLFSLQCGVGTAKPGWQNTTFSSRKSNSEKYLGNASQPRLPRMKFLNWELQFPL